MLRNPYFTAFREIALSAYITFNGLTEPLQTRFHIVFKAKKWKTNQQSKIVLTKIVYCALIWLTSFWFLSKTTYETGLKAFGVKFGFGHRNIKFT